MSRCVKTAFPLAYKTHQKSKMSCHGMISGRQPWFHDFDDNFCFPKTVPSPSLRPRPNHQPLKDGPSPRCKTGVQQNPTSNTETPIQSHRLKKFEQAGTGEETAETISHGFRMDFAWILTGHESVQEAQEDARSGVASVPYGFYRFAPR